MAWAAGAHVGLTQAWECVRMCLSVSMYVLSVSMYVCVHMCLSVGLYACACQYAWEGGLGYTRVSMCMAQACVCT